MFTHHMQNVRHSVIESRKQDEKQTLSKVISDKIQKEEKGSS